MPQMDDQLSADEKTFLAELLDDGSAIGNGLLRKQLKWDPEKYTEVRKSLVDKGLVQLGRGRGGSVRKVPARPAKTMVYKAHRRNYRPLEESAYPVFWKALTTWAKKQKWNDFFIHHKPRHGRKRIGM